MPDNLDRLPSGHRHCAHWQEGDGDCCDCKKPNWCPDEGVTPENERALRAAWEGDPGRDGRWDSL